MTGDTLVVMLSLCRCFVNLFRNFATLSQFVSLCDCFSDDVVMIVFLWGLFAFPLWLFYLHTEAVIHWLVLRSEFNIPNPNPTQDIFPLSDFTNPNKCCLAKRSD